MWCREFAPELEFGKGSEQESGGGGMRVAELEIVKFYGLLRLRTSRFTGAGIGVGIGMVGGRFVRASGDFTWQRQDKRRVLGSGVEKRGEG